jgi:hypothetical protein
MPANSSGRSHRAQHDNNQLPAEKNVPNKMTLCSALPLVAVGTLALLARQALAGVPGSDPKVEVITVIHAAEERLHRGVDASTFFDNFYAPDVVMIGGDGIPRVERGKAALLKVLQGWFDAMGSVGLRTCRYAVEEPVMASPTLVTTLMLLSCEAPNSGHAEASTGLYVWSMTAAGWRVAQEVWVPGKL